MKSKNNRRPFPYLGNALPSELYGLTGRYNIERSPQLEPINKKCIIK